MFKATSLRCAVTRCSPFRSAPALCLPGVSHSASGARSKHTKGKNQLENRYTNKRVERNMWVTKRKLDLKTPGFGMDLPNTELLYGWTPVLAALKQGQREIFGLYVQGGYEGDHSQERSMEIVEIVQSMDLMVKEASKSELDQITDNRLHQGIVLRVGPFPAPSIKELGEFANGQHTVKCTSDRLTVHGARRKYPLWLFLDGIQDTHNLGSILRSALYFGIDAVVLCGRESCHTSPTVSKTSAGAMECMSIFKARMADKLVKKAKNDGWKVVCTTTHSTIAGESIQASELPELDSPTILVMGSEGTGISQPILELSDINVHIPAKADVPSIVDSLNVGVAAAIILSSLKMPE
ncbi:hypothetical protein GGI15_000604 [Coemansia interrupta]|uniref:rRNA methyltransferase 1, mitochondrial n=1 Tax=Coemansia interrupta TaxID=1126814 RepID=A0A9W8HRV2_9FUNG|nr:hypothetical protein GGI15_000604 [Coemansia interrupta]